MAVVIAGRNVAMGSTLYHVGYRTWGTVVRFDTNSAVLRLTGTGGATREVYVTNGGIVGSVRQVYWHEPIELDLPVQDVTKYQKLVDFAVEEL